MPPTRRAARGPVTCLAVVVALTTGGCTSSKHRQPSGPSGTSASAAGPTRWWSNSAAGVGSTIDPANPGAAAAKLHPSQSEYCGMLKQTLDARKSILPKVQANDPAVLTRTEAFVAEIEHVAPASIAGSWQVLGPAIVGVIKSGGQFPSSAAGSTAKALQAAQAVNVDAQKNCGLDLSAVITGG